MSGSNSALAVMDDDHDGDDSKSKDYSTRKEKFYEVNQDIAKLVAEEQIAAVTDGTSILSAITECKARALRLLKDPNRQDYLTSNIESSDAFLRSHTDSIIGNNSTWEVLLPCRKRPTYLRGQFIASFSFYISIYCHRISCIVTKIWFRVKANCSGVRGEC